MERTVSQEERIRRAEEIYNRRRIANGVRVSSSSVNRVEKKKVSLFKKMIMQLVICSVIYIILYLIKNTNYIFSDDVINKTKEFLNYDINFGYIGQQITSFLEENFNGFNIFNSSQEDNSSDGTNGMVSNEVTSNEISNEQSATNNVQENNIDQNANQENIIEGNTVQENNTAENVEVNSNNKDNANEVVGGIGGASGEENSEEENLSQSEKDIKYLKENYSFIVPVTGTVTSPYGEREATEVVSANHKGIDIGANEGTAIYASMEGTVKVSSEEGEYGKHIDIVNGDVLTRYAHCSKLLVKEGDKVKQGDKIAEVGSTGNSTGPHLHFEIRIEDRTINPSDIIDF